MAGKDECQRSLRSSQRRGDLLPIHQNVAIREDKGSTVLRLTTMDRLFMTLKSTTVIAENSDAERIVLVARRNDGDHALREDENNVALEKNAIVP